MKTIRRILCPLLLTGATLLTSCVFASELDLPDTKETDVRDTVESTAPVSETESVATASVYQALVEALRTEGAPYEPSSGSKSGFGLPYMEHCIRKFYEAKTGDSHILIGINDLGHLTMISDHYKALVTLTVYEDGQMHIRVKSNGNYECEETVTAPTAISERSLFSGKNLSFSSTEHEYAPRYYLFYAMHLMDEIMEELDNEFSFEALGYTYADYQTYQYHLYS
jgi:hypothetical protein